MKDLIDMFNLVLLVSEIGLNENLFFRFQFGDLTFLLLESSVKFCLTMLGINTMKSHI